MKKFSLLVFLILLPGCLGSRSITVEKKKVVLTSFTLGPAWIVLSVEDLEGNLQQEIEEAIFTTR